MSRANDLSLLLVRLILAYGFYEPAMSKWRDINAVASWFGESGIYAYMKDILTPEAQSFQISPQILSNANATLETQEYSVKSLEVHHGPLPALAFRIDIGDKSVVLSGDTDNDAKSLVQNI